MTPLVVIGLAAGGIATLAVFRLVSPVLAGRMVWPAGGAALASAAVTIPFGVLTRAGTPEYFIGLASFTLPVLILLEAAAIGSGADRTARWVLMLAWGVLVFPVTAVVPLLFTANCIRSDCRFEDFGGALPLFVSSTVFVFLAWLPAGIGRRRGVDRRALSGGMALVAVASFWLAYVIWLTSLEGDFDVYTPRILVAAAVGPASAALGWLLVDRLRDTHSPPLLSVGCGLLAGMLATTPGAVTVSFPWSVVVGGLAGIVAGLVFSTRAFQSTSVAVRWGLALFSATAVGFLAPPISGDTVGILFSAQVSALAIPAIAFVGVALYSVLVSAPAWILLRRHATRAKAARDQSRSAT